jgi:MFS family permease
VYVLDLVGRGRLASAVSLYEVILNTSRVLGPAVGGVMLAAAGPGACVLTNALCYVAPLAVLLRLKPAVAEHEDAPSPSAGPAPARPARASRRGATLEGLRYAWSVPTIRSCLLIAAASGVLFNATLMFPLMAVRVFHLGGGGYGALLSAFGVGALPGALLAARGGEPTGRQVALLAGATGACTAATAFSPVLALLYVGAAAMGFSSIWMVARTNTLVQLRAQPEMRGRVMGAWTMALPGASPITSIAVGVLADAAGARTAFASAGVLMLAIVAGSWHGLAAGPGRLLPGTAEA